MNNLFKLAQPKGKWHKLPPFNLGGGAKLYKNFAQKLLAVSLCMAMVLLGTPVTTFAEDDVPVAVSVYIKATNVPELKVGEALPSLDDVQLEVTVFAPDVDSPSASVDDVVLLKDGNDVTEGVVEADASYSLGAVFGYDGSFTVDNSTSFASNLGVTFAGVDSGLLVVMLPLGDAFPVVTVDVVDVPDLEVGQHFPELDLDKNFTVSVTPADGYAVTSASVYFATWCTTSDWTSVAEGAVVQPGVSYGIGAIVVGNGALNGGPSARVGVASSSPVGAVFALDDDVLCVGLVVGGDVPAGAVQLKPSDLSPGDPTHWTSLPLGGNISLWREVNGVYQTQNQSTAFPDDYKGVLPNMTPCVLEVPVEVPAAGGVLSFDFKVSSEKDKDYLRFKVLDSSGVLVCLGAKSGLDSDFDTVEQDLNGGSYTLKFTYLGDYEGCWAGADAGYVKNIAFTPDGSATPTPLQPNNLDSAPGSVMYMSQNQGSNSTACTMEVPVEVGAGGAELMFDWMVSSERDYDFLSFELKDADGTVLHSAQKSGEETSFDRVVIPLGSGNYTLKFTYLGDNWGWWDGDDTGYVTNIYLVPSGGVSGISKTMFALPSDLTNSETFSLSGLDVSKVGRVSFGHRPADAKYIVGYDDDDNAIVTTAQKGSINWLIAGSDAADSVVLYSEEPLISANVAVYEYDEDSDSYPPPPGGTDSRFQPTYYDDDNAYWRYWVGSEAEKASFTADWGSYTAGQEPDHVRANHWGASNLRKVLQQIYAGDTDPYKGFFNATEKGLMDPSTITTYDMQGAEFDADDNYVSGAKAYTTKDVLYAPRFASTNFVDASPRPVHFTIGSSDALKVSKSFWGGYHWLRSPEGVSSLDVLCVRPGSTVNNSDADDDAYSVSAAFRLDLSSVLFTSAASAASSAEDGKFSKISADTPMTLRVNNYCGGTATLSTDKNSITVKNAAEGDVLMVQGVTDAGENWSYSKKMTGTAQETLAATTVQTDGEAEITGFTLSDFSNCNIWLERTAGSEDCTVTYASTPIVAGATESTSHAGCTPEAVSQLDATCTEPGHQAHYKCSVCGQLFSDEDGKHPTTAAALSISATGHDSSGAWQKDETHHWKVCGTCSEKIENAEHTWDGGTVTTQPTTSAPGVKTYKCSVCGHTRTETIPKLDGDDLQDFRPDGTTEPATWGSAVTRGNIPHWVAADGTTSVQVPAGNGIIWLKEDSDGTSAWYGLDNSAGVFAEGSRFWVRWLSKKSDPELWQYYYDKFDTEHKTDVESDNLWIFLIGVTAPDGTEYTDFGTQVPLYIQKGPDWDGNDIRSVFISGASDEVLLSHFHGTMDYPESALHPAAEFYKIMLSHFSPYAIFDELTDEEKAALGLPSTGDISTELLISGLAIVLVSSLGVMLRLITSKKKFEE